MIYKLEQWSYGASNGDSFLAPEMRKPGLCGKVYGNSKFQEGLHIITSTIVDYDAGDNTFITKSGSKYQLGEPDPDYANVFPNAKNRLIKSILEKKDHGETNQGDKVIPFLNEQENDFDDIEVSDEMMNEWLNDD